jgi:hypothetical protein
LTALFPFWQGAEKVDFLMLSGAKHLLFFKETSKSISFA